MTLLLEDACCSLSRVEGTVEVDLHDLAPLTGSIVFGGNAGCNAGVRDENVKLSKVRGYLLDNSLDLFLVGDVGLVRSCAHVVRGRDLGSGGIGRLG